MLGERLRRSFLRGKKRPSSKAIASRDLIK
jgi:hypothetical protein